MAENPEEITYKQLWSRVFEGYERKGNRLKRIFDVNSDYNKRLTKYCQSCEELMPEFDKELKKLGFKVKRTLIYPDYVTPDSEDFYFNNKGDIISACNGLGIMVVNFNDKRKSFESDVIGDKQRMALEWIKEVIDES